MYFFRKFFFHEVKEDKPIVSNIAQETDCSVSPTSGYFEFHDGVLVEEDRSYSKATFEMKPDGSGTVFFDFRFGRRAVSTFRIDTSSKTTVFRVSDGEEIGFVDDDGDAYLSRAGIHNRALKTGRYPSFPDPLFLKIGRLMGGDENGCFSWVGRCEPAGDYRGAKAAAGAALIALIYECHSRGWHSFYEYNN